MWIENVAMFFVILFAIIGVSTVSVIFHEYSHFNDFKDLNVSNQQICALMLPTEYNNWSDFINSPIGLYSFSTNESDSAIYQKIESRTETKAYFFSGVVFTFFIVCFLFITWVEFKKEVKMLEMGWEIEEKDIYIKQLEVSYGQ